MSLMKTKMRWQEILDSGRTPKTSIRILTSFTADPLVPYLGVSLEDNHLPSQLSLGPYQQIIQECISDDSETAQLKPNYLVIWARLEELWKGKPLPLKDSVSFYSDEAEETVESAIKACKRWNTTLLYILPTIPELSPLGIGDAMNLHGVFSIATQVREILRKRICAEKGAFLLDSEEFARALGIDHCVNHRLNVLAHIPYSNIFFENIGTGLARLITLTRRSSKKIIVLDADNTLWGGVVGEQGAHGVDLKNNAPGEAYRNFQSFNLELRNSGMLLAVCSKNNESDVWEVFNRREMILQKQHLSAWRINWQPKSINLKEISEETSLGLDSFVFIDDNPAEISEVNSVYPEVSTLRMPEDSCEWVKIVKETSLFDRLPPTSEDLHRAQSYEEDKNRTRLLSASSNLEEYRKSLKVQISIFQPDENDVERFTQLINKTNQFNLNCRRRTEQEVAAIIQDPSYEIRLVRAKDRFGDYGIIGAFVLLLEKKQVVLDTFLLSCRSIGRGIENAMIASIFEIAGPGKIILARLEECPRNEPARIFFSKCGVSQTGVTTPLVKTEWPDYIGTINDSATQEDNLAVSN